MQYRRAADAESYGLVASRQSDPRWELPLRAVEPAQQSRMYVGTEEDCGPQPLDDPAAHVYMDSPACFDNSDYYDAIATRANTENPIWYTHLQRNEQGLIDLNLPAAHELALLHSREYQTQFELVYLDALRLTGNRFEFATQWSGGLGLDFTARGDDLGGNKLLGLSDRLGLSRNFAGGGQFATSILNSLVWDFGSGSVQSGSAAIVSTFTQPLLRGAYRHVRLESLTQAERDLLYSVRQFARFRRTFYLDVTSSYLSLLTQSQAIRNIQTTVDNLRRSREEYDLYTDLGIVSPVEVDQVTQDFQRSQLQLLSAQQNLAESLDQFKAQLGLPPWVPFEIDESLLKPFELIDSDVVLLQSDAQALYQELVQYLPPEHAPRDELQSGLERYIELRTQLVEKLPAIREEFEAWRTRLDEIDESSLQEDDALDYRQQTSIVERIDRSLTELEVKFARFDEKVSEIQNKIDAYDSQPANTDDQNLSLSSSSRAPEQDDSASSDDDRDTPEVIAWRAVLDAVGKELREEIAELYVAQTQIRLFSIDVPSLNIEQQAAISFAHSNRLDLMNTRAAVVDAFRRVEVAADALESDLNLGGTVALGSDAGSNSPFSMDSANNTYQLGLQFDGPLNRLNERNVYRTAQLNYQRASRELISTKDQIANEVRSILRQLRLRRLNFQIARQQLVAATRQVDQAQIDLRTPTSSTSTDANLTLFLLSAQEQLLAAKNNLITEWIGHRIQRIRLFTALELLFLDEQGQWINEAEDLPALVLSIPLDTEYFPPEWADRMSPVSGVSDQRLDPSLPSVESLPGSSDSLPLPEVRPEPVAGAAIPLELSAPDGL